MDRRRLYLDEAVDSMFRYCVERLGLSEAAAAKRIQVARLSRRFPVIISHLREGRVHLTALNLLAPQLTEDTLGGNAHCIVRPTLSPALALALSPALLLTLTLTP